mgnify:CR=1 FL=1
MSLIKAFKHVYLEDIFTIAGRASRKEYWGSDLIMFPLFFVVVFITTFISFTLSDLIGNIFVVWIFIGTTTCAIRRMHDVGKSGWYSIIPLYNFLLAIQPSDQSDNDWGSPRPHTIVNQSTSDDEENSV